MRSGPTSAPFLRCRFGLVVDLAALQPCTPSGIRRHANLFLSSCLYGWSPSLGFLLVHRIKRSVWFGRIYGISWAVILVRMLDEKPRDHP